MRINRLDLARYGKFTDGVLDFGSRPIGSPDLHIIYGPNEAGKSTTFDAIVDLIFGIGASSRYGFLHPYPTMRIGADINVGNKNREFVRIKRPQNSLLDDEERAQPEADIRADLGGIDREAFTTMFSLDDESLEKGGEGILASKGNLGELLFAASAGLSDLSKQLTAIRGDADSFYRYRAKSGALGELKSRLADLKQQRDALDLQASEFQRLVIERDRLARLYDEAIGARAGTQRRIDEIRRVLNALPVMSRLSALKDRLTGLEVVPEPPEAWRQEVQDYKRNEIELRVKLQDVSRSIASLEDEIAQIAVDPAASAAAAQIDELSELRARYVTADKDIPKLTARAAELSIENILVQLGRRGESSPERLLLDAATVGSLRELISAKSGVDAKQATAQDELTKAERALGNQAEAEVDHSLASPEQVRAFDALQATLKASPKSDQDVVLRSLARRRDAASETLAEAMRGLRPWQGDVAELSSLVPPSSSRVGSWKARFTALDDTQRASKAELQRLDPEARRLDAEIEALRGQAGSIDEATAAAARTERELAWMAHRQALDQASADAFEKALRADDQLTAQRLMHFAEMGRLSQLLQRRAAVGADIQSQQKTFEEATSDMDALRLEIRQSIGQSDSHPAIADDPWEVEEWLRRREAALRAKAELTVIEREITEIGDHVEHSKRLLVQALTNVKVAFNADADITALTSFAEDALSAFHASANAAIEIERLRKEVAERRHALEVVKEAAREWSTEWETLCGGCWLREIGKAPNVGAVAEILSVLERLSSAVEAREGLVDRIRKMEKDQVGFETRVHEFCASLDLATDGTPLALCQAVFEKIKSTGLDADRLEKLKRDLDDIRRDEHALNVAQDLLVARGAQMLEFFGVATLEQVESGIDLATRRRDLVNGITEAEEELLQMTGRGSVSEVEEITAAVDRSVLEEELAKLVPALDDQDARCQEVFHSRSKAQDALDEIGGDAKVATLEVQRRTTLLEIEESARRYMEVRAGVAATEQALKLYRDRHRSGMMAGASEAFRTISRGAYQGVAAQPGKDGDVLIALSASGGSKAANELSKGARFQLYLALRVAGYHEFVANRTPIPFIADDIMETFDDFRAEEAFRLFAEMGLHGQVIYLTHHRHLTEIARKVCPNVRLHDLEEVGKPAALHVVAAE